MSVTKVDFANRSSKYPCNVDIHNLDLTSSFKIKEVDLNVDFCTDSKLYFSIISTLPSSVFTSKTFKGGTTLSSSENLTELWENKIFPELYLIGVDLDEIYKLSTSLRQTIK